MPPDPRARRSMTSKPPLLRRPVPRRDLFRLLADLGWCCVRRGKGNHVIWQSPHGTRLSLPGAGHGNRPVGDPYLRQINQAHGLRPPDSRARRSGSSGREWASCPDARNRNEPSDSHH